MWRRISIEKLLIPGNMKTGSYIICFSRKLLMNHSSLKTHPLCYLSMPIIIKECLFSWSNISLTVVSSHKIHNKLYATTLSLASGPKILSVRWLCAWAARHEISLVGVGREPQAECAWSNSYSRRRNELNWARFPQKKINLNYGMLNSSTLLFYIKLNQFIYVCKPAEMFAS
jgi:hypothetical protein